MSKRNGSIKCAKNTRCVYSGKVTHNQEVIIAKFAIAYVRKLGYYVSEFRIK